MEISQCVRQAGSQRCRCGSSVRSLERTTFVSVFFLSHKLVDENYFFPIQKSFSDACGVRSVGNLGREKHGNRYPLYSVTDQKQEKIHAPVGVDISFVNRPCTEFTSSTILGEYRTIRWSNNFRSSKLRRVACCTAREIFTKKVVERGKLKQE